MEYEGIEKRRLKPQQYKSLKGASFFTKFDGFSGVLLKPQDKEEEQKTKRFEFVKMFPAFYPKLIEDGKYEIRPKLFKVW